jgi:hypothetical protein
MSKTILRPLSQVDRSIVQLERASDDQIFIFAIIIRVVNEWADLLLSLSKLFIAVVGHLINFLRLRVLKNDPPPSWKLLASPFLS